MFKLLQNNKKSFWPLFIAALCSIFIVEFSGVHATEKPQTPATTEELRLAPSSEEISENKHPVAPVPLDVPLIQQLPELARGCEVTSLAMILQYHGIEVDKMELAENIAYEPFKKNGLRGNMHKGFVGNIETFQESGLGVYAEPIIDLAQPYVDSSRIVNITGQSTDELYNAIDEGSPVWILTNAWFSFLPKEQFMIWETAEGSMEVTYRQHSVVLTYYDDEFVYINDPLQPEQNIALDRTSFEEAWIQMGRQAFYISK